MSWIYDYPYLHAQHLTGADILSIFKLTFLPVAAVIAVPEQHMQSTLAIRYKAKPVKSGKSLCFG